MASEAERLARLEGAYNHLATKADLASLETRLTTWFAGLLLLGGHQRAGHGDGDFDRVARIAAKTAELGSILGLCTPVVLSVVSVARPIGRLVLVNGRTETTGLPAELWFAGGCRLRAAIHHPSCRDLTRPRT